MRIVVARLTLIAVLSLNATGQTQAPPDSSARFEVASIKRNAAGVGAGGGLAGDRYRANNQNALALIMGAFSNDRILNAPDWATDERFDLVAKAPHEIASAQLAPMLLNLLRERFAFEGHRETRNIPVYRLTIVRDGTLGPRLRRSTVDCAEDVPAQQGAARRVTCGGGSSPGKLTFVGLTINTLARVLAAPAGRPVLNETGLTGRFDADLEWSNTLGATDFASVFTAVQEQLGLRLVPSTAPMEVVVVDHIERPSPD